MVGVCAAGILIRAVAPLLNDKKAEPPVVAVSDDGESVVPLLGGHRGANRLAGQIAEILGGKAAVTTAGEVALGIALDEPPEGWVLGTPELAKDAMAGLLSGKPAQVDGDEARRAGWLDVLPSAVPGEDAVEIEATMSPPRDAVLTFHPQRMALGVGCARNCPPEELKALVMGVLTEAEVAPGALRGLFTLDLKADEPAVLALAETLGVPLRVFDAATLEAETPRLETPSDVVFAEVGCHGVAEAAALAGAGPEAALTWPKVKTAMATCALAVAPEPILELRGRARDATWR